MILYPTETLYALGVNALDEEAVTKLYELKGRDSNKVSSWLVRDAADIEQYAEINEKAQKIIERWLPGSITIVLKAKDTVPEFRRGKENEISFRISADATCQSIIRLYMEEFNAPLTCTSANVSGCPTLPTVSEILQQFGPKAKLITKIYDDGPRKSLASTVVRVVDEEVTILREGAITPEEILSSLA